MMRRILHLGRSPLTRRIVAAVLLLATAIIVTALNGRNDQRWIDLTINLAVALVMLGLLHLRWRRHERKQVSPKEARDTFS